MFDSGVSLYIEAATICSSMADFYGVKTKTATSLSNKFWVLKNFNTSTIPFLQKIASMAYQSNISRFNTNWSNPIQFFLNVHTYIMLANQPNTSNSVTR